MLGLRSSPKDDSGFSPAEAVLGSPLFLPDEFLKHTEFPPEIFLHRVNKLSLVSPALLNIMYHLSLNLSLSLKLYWMRSLCLCMTMPQSLCYLLSTEDLTECFDSQRNILFSRLGINPTPCLLTG